ncbi:MAG: hypothetical protein ABIO24_12995, partial [Saprospiraceae bacterium]
TENQFRNMAYHYAGRFNAVIDYNEALSHQIYAGSDFLIMPSRVEPCGLNQMYAMRYGTVPIVRSVGGLKDTVPDIAEPDGAGRGIRFDQATTGDIGYALHRASSMYHQHPDIMHVIRERIMAVDSSWENSIAKYIQVYRGVGAHIEASKPQKASKPTEKTPVPKPPVPKKPAKEVRVAPQEVKSDPAPKAKTTVKKAPSVASKKAPTAKAPPKKTPVPAKPAATKKAAAEKAPKPDLPTKPSPGKSQKTKPKK